MQKKKITFSNEFNFVNKILNQYKLHSICQEAKCPNISECFKKKTATFLIMGDICTRNCTFCGVTKNLPPLPLDENEPYNVAKAVKELDLKYVVITSVTRDDLPDEGIEHFKKTIYAIKELKPNTEIEILTPDFKRNFDKLDKLAYSPISVFNHNLETVPQLYSKVRPKANYKKSLELLKIVKQINPEITTKSGIMVGLGETLEQIFSLIDDLVNVNCDILTVGQYFPPNKHSIKLVDIKDDNFYKQIVKYGKKAGLKFIFAGTYVRSSYNAKEVFTNINTNTN